MIYNCINTDFISVVNSIDILKKEYTILYNYNQELYEEIYRISLEIKKRFEQFNILKDDSSIVNSIIRLIALWISPGVSDKEKDKYFKDIMNEMNYESSNRIITSINRLKFNYPELYKLNSDFLEELKFIVIKNNNLNTPARSTSNNSNNYKNTSTIVNIPINNTPINLNLSNAMSTSNNSSYYGNTSTNTTRRIYNQPINSNSSKSGCATIFVCAIIGAVIIPKIGFFIGAFIRYLISKR